MSQEALLGAAGAVPATEPARYVVGEFAAEDQGRWDRYVIDHPDGTFYHLCGWRQVIGETLGHRVYYLYCERDGVIVGILPLAQVKSWLFGNALISLPFLVYGGPLSSDQTALGLLIGRARELAQELAVDYLEFRNRRPLPGDWQSGGAYATFRKALDPDPAKNLMAIPRKQRAMIRKGIKAGLSAEVDDDTERLYAALLECKRNLGTPFFGPEYLKSVKRVFGDAAEILTVVRGRDLVSSVMSFRFRDQILPYYGGGGHIARDLKGNDYLYWAVMEKACADGVRVFDYGRSMEGTGAYRFKKHWGFEPEPLHYQYHLVRANEVPKLNPSNPKYRLLIDTWRRLPLPVAATLGPPVARLLG